MKKRSCMIFLLAVFLLPASLPDRAPAASDAVERTGPGTVNWTTGMLTAKGSGAPRPDLSPAQSRLMAERAAKAQAYANLLEVLKGVQIDSWSSMENFITTSDLVKTRIQGIIRGAMPVEERYLSDGSYEVTMTMPISGALLDVIIPPAFGSDDTRPAPAMQPGQERLSTNAPAPPAILPVTPGPSVKKPSPLKRQKKPDVPDPLPPVNETDQPTMKFKGGKATGIVIDARGLSLKPALLPKVLDPRGKEVYVGQVVTRTNAVEQGIAGYAKDVPAALNNFRVTDNPAVIKAISSAGAGGTDIVIGQADAVALRTLASSGDFLQYCRVIIVY